MLKRIINEARPEGARLADPGMPSSHAQSLFFFASYLSTAAIFALALPVPLLTSSPPFIALGFSSSLALRLANVAALCSAATAAAGYRVLVGLHSPSQIGVGAAIGSCTGVLWFFVVQHAVHDLASLGGCRTPIIGIVVIGALVVGSVERRFSAMLKKKP